MEQYKACGKCKQTKPIGNFHKQSKSKDGMQSQCKDCKRIGNRLTMQKFRDNNPELHRARNKKYRNADKTKTQLQRKLRHLANKEAENAQARSYYSRNKEVIRANNSTRNRRKSINGIYEFRAKELQKMYAMPCSICGSTESIELDHIVPIAKGGTHSIGNLQPLCRNCNRSKSDKFLIEFKMIRKKLNV